MSQEQKNHDKELQVHVKSLKTGEKRNFKMSENATLEQVWSQANLELGENRGGEDTLRCDGGLDLIGRLNQTVPDRPLPEAADPESARAALLAHMNNALEGYQFEYDNDRTLYVSMIGIRPDGTEDKYLVRLMFLYYPEWPPNVTFVNLETRRYDGTHWPQITGATRLAFTPVYPDAPAGLVCNSMTFEYYFWGGHAPAEAIKWNRKIHTFAATIAELQDHLRPPFYVGRAE